MTTNTPKIGARLMLVTSEGVLLDQWSMDDYNVSRSMVSIDLGLEIHKEIVRADKDAKEDKRNGKG